MSPKILSALWVSASLAATGTAQNIVAGPGGARVQTLSEVLTPGQQFAIDGFGDLLTLSGKGKLELGTAQVRNRTSKKDEQTYPFKLTLVADDSYRVTDGTPHKSIPLSESPKIKITGPGSVGFKIDRGVDTGGGPVIKSVKATIRFPVQDSTGAFKELLLETPDVKNLYEKLFEKTHDESVAKYALKNLILQNVLLTDFETGLKGQKLSLRMNFDSGPAPTVTAPDGPKPKLHFRTTDPVVTPTP